MMRALLNVMLWATGASVLWGVYEIQRAKHFDRVRRKASLRLTGKWTLEERIRVATVLLGDIQLDIPKGDYSAPGRPNITSVLGVLNFPAEHLVPYTEEAQSILDELEQRVS